MVRFLLPATELVSGNVIEIDVDENMIAVCENKA